MSRQRATAVGIILLSPSSPFSRCSDPLKDPPGDRARRGGVHQKVRERAARDGNVRVIVELNLQSGRHVAEGRLLGGAAVAAQRQAITDTRSRILGEAVGRARHRVIHRYQSLPYVALEIDRGALAILENSADDVVSVMEDVILKPVLAQSVGLIQGDQAWGAGYDGSGTVIAVVDSGVESASPVSRTARWWRKRVTRVPSPA